MEDIPFRQSRSSRLSKLCALPFKTFVFGILDDSSTYFRTCVLASSISSFGEPLHEFQEIHDDETMYPARLLIMITTFSMSRGADQCSISNYAAGS
ncbi:hypothetical protein LINPERPRIM_LOCUS34286 [Linum perenne]